MNDQGFAIDIDGPSSARPPLPPPPLPPLPSPPPPLFNGGMQQQQQQQQQFNYSIDPSVPAPGGIDIDQPVEPPRNRETGGVASDLMQAHNPATVRHQTSAETTQSEINPLFQSTTSVSPPGTPIVGLADSTSTGTPVGGVAIDLDAPVLLAQSPFSDALSARSTPLPTGVDISLDEPLQQPLSAAAAAAAAATESIPFSTRRGAAAATPFASLVATLEAQQRASMIDPNQFVGVFFYDGADYGGEPPDITASVQAMQSEDRTHWIVFTDETAAPNGKASCRLPLDDYDAQSAPFCHKSFGANETDEAIELARSLALRSSAHTTAFVVQYNTSAGGQLQATVIDSFVLTNKIDSDAKNRRKSKKKGAQQQLEDPFVSEYDDDDDDDEGNDNDRQARRPTKKGRWILWLIGVAALALVAALITLFIVRNKQRRDNAAAPKEASANAVENAVPLPDAKKYDASATPLAGTFF